MTRSCEKLGCNEPAEVAFGIDRVACVVWLENFDEDEPRHLNRLCDEHAARLTLPRSWSFDDRRESSPRLFVARRAKVATLPTRSHRPTGDTAKPATSRDTAKPATARDTAKPSRKSGNKTSSVPRRTSRDTSTPLKRMTGPSLFDPTLPMNSPLFASTATRVTDDAPAVAPTPVTPVSIEDTEPAAPATPAYAPKFDRSSDVGGALNATGRLLRRAFSSQTKPIERPTVSADTDSLPQGDHLDDFNQGDHVE
jgi:hypothetical protein